MPMPMTDQSNAAENPHPQPLAAIREKENELGQAVRLAHEAAQARVAEARQRAAAIKEQAERDGMQEAENLLQHGIADAREQAHAILLEGESTATKLREHGTARISEAADYIVRFVLPSVEKQ